MIFFKKLITNKNYFNVKLNLLNGKNKNFKNVRVILKEVKKPFLEMKQNAIFSCSTALIYLINKNKKIEEILLSTNILILSNTTNITIDSIDKLFILKKVKINKKENKKLKKIFKKIKILEAKLSLGLEGEEIVLLDYWKKEYNMRYLLLKNNLTIMEDKEKNND